MHPEVGTSVMIVAHWFLKAKRTEETGISRKQIPLCNITCFVSQPWYSPPSCAPTNIMSNIDEQFWLVSNAFTLCRPFSSQNKSQWDVQCKCNSVTLSCLPLIIWEMQDILLGFSNTFSSYHNNLIQYVVLLLWNAKGWAVCLWQTVWYWNSSCSNESGTVKISRPKVRFAAGSTQTGASVICKTAMFHWRKSR